MKRLPILTICLLAATAAFAQAPNTPSVPKKAVQTGPGPKSKEEAQAVQAVMQAQTPDDAIKAAEELVTKFPSGDYKAFALEREAEAYQVKGDNVKTILYGERAIEADPMNFAADNLLANVIAASIKDKDLDKNEEMAKADKYAHDSLTTLDGPKSWLYGDAQWPKVKALGTSQAYQALGILAIAKKQPDEAVADFQKGIDAFPDPLIMIRVGRALLMEKKADAAIVWFDKVINMPDAPDQYKAFAKSDKARAQQSKGK